jgi:tripartite-type tricarboxylate transporter receptor subunit TctC
MSEDPGKYTFSSGGFGTPAHLLGELFKLETGVRATHVPYVQFPQAIGDLVSGVNTYQFIIVLPVVQLIKTGKLTTNHLLYGCGIISAIIVKAATIKANVACEIVLRPE